MRMTIGNKIFAIAASMTLIVALVGILSTYFIGNVTDEVRRVAETYIPLSTAIEGIEDQSHSQKILFVRLVSRLEDGESWARIEAILTDYQARKHKIFAAYQAGLGLLQQAQGEEHFVNFKVELARLTVLMEQVVGAYGALEKQTAKLFDHPKNIVVSDVKEILATRLELERQIAVVTHAIYAFAQQAARKVVAEEIRALRVNIAATIMAAILGMFLAGLIARSLVRPIHRLQAAADEIKNGNLTPQLEVSANDEIGVLTQRFIEMASELRIKGEIKDTFGKYVDPRVVESLTVGEDAGVGDGERRIYTVFFSDIVGFTGISEMLTPKALVNLINAYLSEMSIPIQDSDGVIDKYIGDAIMAYWGPPFTSPDGHAQAACHTALEQQARLIEFRKRVRDITGLRSGAPTISMRIGIATGEVVVGSVGSELVRNYTVIGDTVNLAARLESLGRHYGTSILIGEDTWKAVGDDFEFREIDSISVSGKTESARIFELLAAKGDLKPEQAVQRENFATALEVYRAGDWPAARRKLEDYLVEFANDGPARVILDRLDDLERTPPSDWDGVWRFTQK